jgi:hypothetical protein
VPTDASTRDQDFDRVPHHTPPDVVICFDRDRTISVNPPERERGVPLSWLKHFAHDDRASHIDVWAIGNQHLRYEAAIPGLPTAKAVSQTVSGECSDQPFDTPIGDDATIIPPYEPQRVDRPRLIQEIYDRSVPDCSRTYVVVDDTPLDELEAEGWQYYKPGESGAAVEDSTAPINVPASIPYTDVPLIEEEHSKEFTVSFYVPDGLEYGGPSDAEN